jgi:hypothetical protein
MDGLPQASLFLGIIPALILLYISLKGYEGHYKEKNIFISFIAGIIAGFIAAIIELYTLTAGLVVIVLYPVLEQLIKTMILNIRRLQGKSESVIYGLSLGLGFGSIFTPVSMILANIQTWEPVIFALVIIGSIGIILFQGGTGSLIGYGIYTGKLPKFYLIAILLHIPITGWFFITSYYNIEHLQIGLVLYGLIVYWYCTKKIMSKILSQNEKRKRSN